MTHRGATTQKTAIFILTAMRTSNPTYRQFNDIEIPIRVFSEQWLMNFNTEVRKTLNTEN
jgi:hypothetical protein